MGDKASDGYRVGDEVLHFWPLFFVALLLVNDWIFKPFALLPGWATGKLSDIAGLYFFPLVLSSFFSLGLNLLSLNKAKRERHGRPTKTRLVICYVATCLVFSLIKINPFINGVFESLFEFSFGRSTIVMDATDLICLPALFWSLIASLGRMRSIEEAK